MQELVPQLTEIKVIQTHINIEDLTNNLLRGVNDI